jgi:translation initiation factor 2 gamma subunit (eIF-2gamma)
MRAALISRKADITKKDGIKKAQRDQKTFVHVAHGKSTLVRAIFGVNVSIFFRRVFILFIHTDCKTYKIKN